MKITREIANQDVLGLARKNNVIIVEAATGFGKSKIAIDIHDYMKAGKIFYPKVLLLVNEIPHKQNWIDEYVKHKKALLTENLTIECYASMKNHVNTTWDLVILDEAHHLSDLRQYFLETLRFSKLVLLSATLTKDIRRAVEAMFFDKKIAKYRVSSKQAIESEVLPEPQIFLHELELNNTHANQILTIKKGKPSPVVSTEFRFIPKYLKNYVGVRDMHLEVKCTELEKYNYLVEQVEYFKKAYFNDKQEFRKNLWMRKALDRKIYLGELKTRYVLRCVSEMTNSDNYFERTIYFCTSIRQADSLGLKGTNVVHSKEKNVERIISDFQEKKIHSLFCVNMLREGMNLRDIDTGYIIQLDGQELHFIQKMGRVMRAKNPKIHIIFFKSTRDEEYLEKILEHVDTKYVEFI